MFYCVSASTTHPPRPVFDGQSCPPRASSNVRPPALNLAKNDRDEAQLGTQKRVILPSKIVILAMKNADFTIETWELTHKNDSFTRKKRWFYHKDMDIWSTEMGISPHKMELWRGFLQQECVCEARKMETQRTKMGFDPPKYTRLGEIASLRYDRCWLVAMGIAVSWVGCGFQVPFLISFCWSSDWC